MINHISDFVTTYWTTSRKIRRAPSGWMSGNAVCCVHNGESADTRNRGGLIVRGDGTLTWHCFNCGYVASYKPGLPLGVKFKRLLAWMGVDETDIGKLALHSMKLAELVEPLKKLDYTEPTYVPRELPPRALPIVDWLEYYSQSEETPPPELLTAAEYVIGRGIDIAKWDIMWSPDTNHSMAKRVIVPIRYRGIMMGYTARAIEADVKRYHSDHPADLVFGIDNQPSSGRCVFVVEGTFDAMSIGGVATMTNGISDSQARIISNLNREVIVVPDFDCHYNKQGKPVWPGKQAVDIAMKNNWTIAWPVWKKHCKDANSALIKHGKLFTIQAILKDRTKNRLKNELSIKNYLASMASE